MVELNFCNIKSSLFCMESVELDSSAETFVGSSFDAVGVSAETLQIHKRLTDTHCAALG